MNRKPRPERGGAFVCAAFLLGLVFLAHWHVHAYYLRGLNSGGSSSGRAAISPAVAPHAAAAHRVRILVIDGLGWNAAASFAIPELRALAAEGVSRPLLAGFPSFTYASITTMATGRSPREHGVHINGPRPALPWDSVSKSAAASGIAVRVAPGKFRNFAPLLLLPDGAELSTLEAILTSPDNALRAGRGSAPGPAPREIDWLYFGGVDSAGHHHGAASPEYEAAAREAGKVLGRIRAVTDPETDALVVVSDHGHLTRGGHGGAEPQAVEGIFFAMGRGIPAAAAGADGALPPAPMRNLAGTLCELMGILPPADATGELMADVFGRSPGVEDTSDAIAETAARAAFTAHASRRLGIESIALMIAVILGLRGLASLGSAVTPRDALPVVAFSALFLAGYFALGYRITWSVPRSQLIYQTATGLLALAAVAASIAVSRPGRRTQEAAAFAVLLGGTYVLSTAWIGFEPGLMAGPFASFFFLIAVTMLFYPGLVFGLRALPPVPGGWKGRVGLATFLLFLFVMPFVVRFTIPP